ncbi:MAG: PCMD domain-containing protein [Coprobacter sp.]|nr:PCMD domain-containing protein [Coprobacter sp.]
MKKSTTLYIGLLAALLALLSGACRQDEQLLSGADGDGILRIGVRVDDAVKMVPVQLGRTTRAALTRSDLEKSCRIEIRNPKGLVRRYEDLATMPGELHLVSDTYTVTVVAGDSLPASFDTPLYRGAGTFTVEGGGRVTDAQITCRLVDVVAAVTYDESVTTLIDTGTASLTVSSSTGSLTFAGATRDSLGYYMMHGGETTLKYTLEAENLADRTPITLSGEIPDVKPCHKYTLTFVSRSGDWAEGGAFFDVIVDETCIEVNEEVYIRRRPDISGDGFDIRQPLYLSPDGEKPARTVSLRTTSRLMQATLSSTQFGHFGIPATQIDLLSDDDDDIPGITFAGRYDPERDASVLDVTFDETFMAQLEDDSEYTFTFDAVDSCGYTRTQDFVIILTDATVATVNAAPGSIWTGRARLQGRRIKEVARQDVNGEPLSLTFNYRPKDGSSDWISVEATEDPEGGTFWADIDGLEPATTYEYVALEGTQPSVITCTFTTETAAQLPNSGFENWSKPGKILYIYGDGEEMFWDSGNTGSSTLNVNVTEYDESNPHSGIRCAKLKSQKVALLGIGKFAAGNLFAGAYVGTDGTDGILDFGRPFTSRPKALRGWWRYNIGTIDETGSGVPDGVSKGQPDIGNIYIAIGDWDSPVRIETKTKKLFDPEDPHIIAYKSVDITGSQPGWEEFTLELDYRDYNRKPTYIVVVASASKYGDYFTGSTASTLWLDDFSLIYE